MLDITLEELFEYAERNQIEVVQITYDHLFTLSALPQHHSDPFDRIIISQAIAEKMIIISKDKELKKYKVKKLWD